MRNKRCSHNEKFICFISEIIVLFFEIEFLCEINLDKNELKSLVRKFQIKKKLLRLYAFFLLTTRINFLRKF